MTSSATQEVHDLLFKTMSLILKFFFAPALITVNRVIAKTHQKVLQNNSQVVSLNTNLILILTLLGLRKMTQIKSKSGDYV